MPGNGSQGDGDSPHYPRGAKNHKKEIGRVAIARGQKGKKMNPPNFQRMEHKVLPREESEKPEYSVQDLTEIVKKLAARIERLERKIGSLEQGFRRND